MGGRTESGADPRTGPVPAIPGGDDGAGSAVDLSVVVPAYNEERRLRPTLDAICAHLRADPDRWGDWELIVVDDGSTDGTAAVAAAAASDEPRIHVLTGDENRGKGYALRQASWRRTAGAYWSRTPIWRRRSRNWTRWTRC